MRRFEVEKRNLFLFVKVNGDWKDGKWICILEDGFELLVEELKNSENVGVLDNVICLGLGFNVVLIS